MDKEKPQSITLETTQLVSIPKAAKLLGIHFTTLYRWVEKGKLTQIRIGDQTYLDAAQVEELKNKSA